MATHDHAHLPMRDHVPVAIVGAGPTGLTLANLLGRHGVETLLVERNLDTVQEPRAVSIDDESLRTMQAAGIASEVMSQLVPGYGSHYHGPDGRCFARVEPTGRPFGYPRRNAFRQPILEAQLRAGLARFPHVETRFGATLVRHEQSDEGVTLHLSGPDGDRTITCDYLIACDGASSPIRTQLGIELAGTTFDERWLIVDLEGNENTTRHTEVFCNPARSCITLPGPDRTRRFEFKLHDGERDADLLAPETVNALIRSHGADPAATIRRKTVYRFHARVAPRWSVGRIILAGDAAHLTPPFAGQGMNSGIRDAHNLAWKLAAVTSGQLPPSLLATYERERRDHIWQMVRLALRMGRVMSPRSRLDGLRTRLIFRALSLWPPARDYITQMKYKPPPRFHAGFLLPDGRGRASMIGRLLPQPMVTTSAGAMLLDEALGLGFALVAHGPNARATLDSLQKPVGVQLAVTSLALLPPGSAPAPGCAVLADAAADNAFAPYEGCALLLRPDRYVAAALPAADPPAAEARLRSLLATLRGEAQTVIP